jgi:hypothetical protein
MDILALVQAYPLVALAATLSTLTIGVFITVTARSYR